LTFWLIIDGTGSFAVEANISGGEAITEKSESIVKNKDLTQCLTPTPVFFD
jgi:hypothetical protein